MVGISWLTVVVFDVGKNLFDYLPPEFGCLCTRRIYLMVDKYGLVAKRMLYK